MNPRQLVFLLWALILVHFPSFTQSKTDTTLQFYRKENIPVIGKPVQDGVLLPVND